MIRSVRPIAMLGVFALLSFAQPASADDGRRHVMTPTQKIDLVRDLPNDETFERDGDYFDLGFLYPIHTMNGASVATRGGDAGFVLYHDDRYIRLGPSELSALTYALGDDPTAGYSPPVPASEAPSAPDSWSRPSFADRRAPGPASGAAASVGLGIGAGVGWFFFLIVCAAMVGVRILRGMARGASQLHRERVHASGGDTGFEERVAARLAELQSGAPAASPSSPAAQRSFGRKLG